MKWTFGPAAPNLRRNKSVSLTKGFDSDKGKRAMDDTQKGLIAWTTIIERANQGKPLKGLEKEIALVGKFIASRNPAVVTELLDVAGTFSKKSGFTAPQAAASPPKRYPRVLWKYHTKKGSDGKEHKFRWTCTWEGMKLRVEHQLDQAQLVVFRGFIEDETVAEEKGLALAQSAVAAKALDRARARDAT